jgi:hypothetical protein
VPERTGRLHRLAIGILLAGLDNEITTVEGHNGDFTQHIVDGDPAGFAPLRIAAFFNLVLSSVRP